ncbi:MAG: PLP-dependent aminotransferase family protein [Acidovorax sp.]
MSSVRISQASGEEKSARWRAAIAAMGGPLYLRIVELLAQEVREGRLAAGAPLPSQRDLAKQLGVNFTTVTRAYDEAKRIGLVQSHHGQGTFVSGGKELARSGIEPESEERAREPIDLTSTWPPNLEIASTLAAAVQQLTDERSFDFLARRAGAVPALDLTAGRGWLQPRFDAPLDGRLTMASGTRNALIALLSSLVGTGEQLLVESMCWPTVRTLATVLGIQLVPVALDAEGILPEALDAAAQASQAKVLYCVPTLQNPSGAVMSLNRRRALIEVAQRRGLTIIEDDAYGGLHSAPPPLLGALAPDITYSIFGLAKLISPSLRVSYVVAPDATKAARLMDILRATMQTVPALEAALATHLIRHGQMTALIEQVRAEAKARQALVKQLLGGHAAAIADEALFFWLPMPAPWDASDFAMRLRREGVAVAPAKVFSLEPASAPNAVRIATGAVSSRDELSLALRRLRGLLSQNPSLLSAID